MSERKNSHLFRKSPQFFKSEENAEAALRWTIQADARKCAKYLLNLPRSAHETPWILLKNRRQATPIHLAAKYGHVKILKASMIFLIFKSIKLVTAVS